MLTDHSAGSSRVALGDWFPAGSHLPRLSEEKSKSLTFPVIAYSPYDTLPNYATCIVKDNTIPITATQEGQKCFFTARIVNFALNPDNF